VPILMMVSEGCPAFSGHNKVLPVNQVTDDELLPDGAFGICPEVFDH